MEKLENVRNIKTGTTGIVVCRYNRTNDGRAIVEVCTGAARNAHWLAAHVEAE